MKKLLIATVTVSVVSAFNMTANALVFTGNAIGSWNDRVPEPGHSQSAINNNDVNGVAKVSWGDPAYCRDKPSYLSFDGAGSDTPADPLAWSSGSNPFLLGNLTYYNGVQWANTGLDGVDLNMVVTIVTPSLLPISTFEFKLGINNTINPNGDTVQFLNFPSPQSFSFGSENYSFEIVGFSLNGGRTMSRQIYACERSCISGGFFGRIIDKGPFTVPDQGATIILLGLAALGLGMVRSKFAR